MGWYHPDAHPDGILFDKGLSHGVLQLGILTCCWQLLFYQLGGHWNGIFFLNPSVPSDFQNIKN